MSAAFIGSRVKETTWFFTPGRQPCARWRSSASTGSTFIASFGGSPIDTSP